MEFCVLSIPFRQAANTVPFALCRLCKGNVSGLCGVTAAGETSIFIPDPLEQLSERGFLPVHEDSDAVYLAGEPYRAHEGQVEQSPPIPAAPTWELRKAGGPS